MSTIVRVGLIGCGEAAQVLHIPTLNYLSDYFRITYLCDVSPGALAHCAQKVVGHIPPITTDVEVLCSSTDVDTVFVINSDEYHAEHAILALKNNKHVFIEKPMALCERDTDAIIEAEKQSRGKLMVGYMRRYAAAFIDAAKEVGAWKKLCMLESEYYVSQSGTEPRYFSDTPPRAARERLDKISDILQQALVNEAGLELTSERKTVWRLLGGLASHDLSAMREMVGMPEAVVGATLGLPYWTAIFKYPTFPLVYESGVDDILRFDAHIEVCSMRKSIRVQWDSGYIKGLPVTMHIRENINDVCHETMVRRTYENPYTLEMRELYEMVTKDKSVKTTAEDAKKELEIFQMIMRSASKC